LSVRLSSRRRPVEICSLAYESHRFTPFHTSGEERLLITSTDYADDKRKFVPSVDEYAVVRSEVYRHII
jgi:hypothetical protein